MDEIENKEDEIKKDNTQCENVDESVNLTKKQTAEEIVLNHKPMQGFFKSFIFGILYGLAIIVPGISGAAIAIIFKMYDQLIYSVSNIFKHFKKCFTYILPVILGLIVGFVVGFFAIQKLLQLMQFSLVLLFAGLMVGSFPAVLKQIKGNKKTPINISLLIVGALLPIIITLITSLTSISSIQNDIKNTADVINSGDIARNFFKDFPFWMFIVIIPIGMVVGTTQVVPGLSATAFLMMVGFFKPIMDSIHFSFIKENPLIIVFLLIMVVAFLAGFFLTSKLVEFLTKKNRVLTYQSIVGLSLGSIISMFFNPEMMQVYFKWAIVGINTTLEKLDVILAAPLFIIGVVGAYFLIRYELKKEK